jgi:Pyruvate/2-oxoacid:ferredoxin oxidoreductase delta subunit
VGLLTGEELPGGGYRPGLLHRWLQPRRTGNEINGLGERRERPATPVYHRQDRWHPWYLVNVVFLLKQSWDFGPRGIMTNLLRDFRNKKAERARREHVASTRAPPTTPAEWRRRLEERIAVDPGVDHIGVAKLHEGLYFDWDYPTEAHRPVWIVVLLRRMDYGEFASNLTDEDWTRTHPFWRRKWVRTIREVMQVYADVHQSAIDLAAWIRDQGHYAEGLGGAPSTRVNLLRAALEAGLGELGKHGSLINGRHGSAVRLAAVLTDLPLGADGPADFGADDFCTSCQLCTISCPPRAISDAKQWVRGVEKWYVDFDKCVPYFNDTHGCGICLSACPWSRPGIAENLVKKMARRRSQRAAAASRQRAAAASRT